jgi:DNA-binding response OmpR family regulator
MKKPQLRSRSRVAYVNGRAVPMTLLEYRLLCELKSVGQLGRDELEKRLWPDETSYNPNRLDVTLWKLRRRLGEGSITNRSRVGWSLNKRLRVVVGGEEGPKEGPPER